MVCILLEESCSELEVGVAMFWWEEMVHNLFTICSLGQHTFSHLRGTNLGSTWAIKLDCASLPCIYTGPFIWRLSRLASCGTPCFVARFMHVIVSCLFLTVYMGGGTRWQHCEYLYTLLLSVCLFVTSLLLSCVIIRLSLLYFSFFRPVCTAQDIVLVSNAAGLLVWCRICASGEKLETSVCSN